MGQSHARFPDLPDLEWTIPTLSQIVGSIRVAFFKRDETFPTGWETLFCEVLDEDLALSSGSNYFSSFATAMVSGQGLTYTLTAEASCGLYNLITSEYQLRVSSQTCGGNWQQAFASRLTVNPSTGFAVRFHHRDHLGSSAVSRAYSPGFDEAVAGAAPFYLKTASGNMTLYAKPAKATLFDPFGEVLGSVAGEPNPRYTDHEYDEASGLNYMKGRFSLAAYGGKFNRPDPMRDWDWENPHSINLYQYARNNPINNWDPNGFAEYNFHFRSFISGFLAGFTFRGDGRGFTLAENSFTVTSRIRQQFSFNTDSGQVSLPITVSDPTVLFPGFGTNDVSKSHGGISLIEKPKGYAFSWLGQVDNSFQLFNGYKGADPFLWVAGDALAAIDLNSEIKILENKSENQLIIELKVTGDGFPSFESFIEDSNGERVFLGTFSEKGRTVQSLFGDKEIGMVESRIVFQVDEKGNFTGVIWVNGIETTIRTWNEENLRGGVPNESPKR